MGANILQAMASTIYETSIASMLKPVEALLNHPEVTEVMINGPNEVFVEMGGKLRKTDAKFAGDEELLATMRVIGQFVGKVFDKRSPRMDARLPDGSRVQARHPPEHGSR